MRKFLIILISVLFLITSCKTSNVPKDEPIVIEEAQLVKEPEVNLIEESPVDQAPQVETSASESDIPVEEEIPSENESSFVDDVFTPYESIDSEKPFNMDSNEQFDSTEVIASEIVKENITEETIEEDIAAVDSEISDIIDSENSEVSFEESLETSPVEVAAIDTVLEEVADNQIIMQPVVAEEIGESIVPDVKEEEATEKSIKDILNAIIAFIMKEKLLSFGLLVTLIGIIYVIAALFKTSSGNEFKYIDVPDDPEEDKTSYHYAEKIESQPIIVEPDEEVPVNTSALEDDDDDFLKSLLKEN